MSDQQFIVMVMESDPQVLKGLVLLLEDMQLNVISAHNFNDLETVKTIQPDLLILPLEFDGRKSGIDLVSDLRAHFNHQIPAILFCYENGSTHFQTTIEDIVVLSDQMNSKNLRRLIKTILANRDPDISNRHGLKNGSQSTHQRTE